MTAPSDAPPASVDRSTTTTTDADPLADRYGRTPRRRRWNRRGLWIVAAAFVAVFTAWVIWGGFDGTADEIDTLDVAHTVLDDASVSITYQVTLPPGSSARCALEAQNEVHGIVGWKIVDVPASDLRTRSFTEVVRTTEQSVTGLIYRCWPA